MNSFPVPGGSGRHDPLTMITTYEYNSDTRVANITGSDDYCEHVDQAGTRNDDFEIVIENMDGWLRVYSKQDLPYAEVGTKLSQQLSRWQNEHPELQIRTIVPIIRNGNTVELHAWHYPISPDAAILVTPKEDR